MPDFQTELNAEISRVQCQRDEARRELLVAERPSEVFEELVAVLPESEQAEWRRRWAEAQRVEERSEAAQRAHDEAWDRSLMGVTRFGQ